MLWFGSHWLPLKCRFCCTCNMILLFFFNCRFKLENNQRVTVQDYFRHKKNISLKHPYLPCLHVGSLNRETPIYLPSEVRKILFLIDEWLHSKSSPRDIWRGMTGGMYLPFHEIHYTFTSEGRHLIIIIIHWCFCHCWLSYIKSSLYMHFRSWMWPFVVGWMVPSVLKDSGSCIFIYCILRGLLAHEDGGTTIFQNVRSQLA
jgi:hypothetical protein